MPSTLRILAAVSLLICLAAHPAAAAPCPAGETIACTDLGAVRGVEENGIVAFKGMPYAQPPVGARRFRPPEPAQPWQGVRDGSKFGAICPQVVGKTVEGDEDCLTVNVWRPRHLPARKLPVMIWLTGGGNHSQSGQGADGFGGVVYNGAELVPHGVVFVSYNLRLNVLGFLAHPALDAERPEKISGNYGSLDQIAMLNWVRRNIAAFGGDPSRVFLFGTSAGGGNICALMTSPLTRGMIHGVAMESSVPNGCEIQTLADAEARTGASVVKSVGCDTAADVAACLRGKSVTDLVSAVPGYFSVLPRVYGPVMDGHVFPDQPIKRIAAHEVPAMPVIIGNTAGETLGWADTAGKVTDEASYEAAIDKVFGAATRPRILALYPMASYASPRVAFARVTTDAEFTCQTRRVARTLFRAQAQPVYRYYFDHTPANDPKLKAAGPAHTAEHPYLFAFQGTYRPDTSDLAIQKEMVAYWSSMAATGSPNRSPHGPRRQEVGPQWPAFSPENEAYLEIGDVTQAKAGPADAHCDFWDGVTLPWPHL
jgi:para-nitrobenzyl esterase